MKPIFQAISAKVGPNDDIPCCEWVGPRGAGHYVKMVHNGIEYGDMQLICEAYWMLKNALGLSNDELYDVFAAWNRGELDSYLIEITRDIFSVKDAETGEYLVDKILDTAGAKGTGKWMSQLALDLGVPSTLVTEAVYARCALGDEGRPRCGPARCCAGPAGKYQGDRGEVHRAGAAGTLCLEDLQLRPGLRANAGRGRPSTTGRWISARSPCCGAAAASSARCSWSASRRRSTRTRSWKTCCLAPYFQGRDRAQAAWRQRGGHGGAVGHSHAGLRRGLAYYDGYRRARLPANLLQAQRDYLRRPHLPTASTRRGFFTATGSA